MISPVIDKLVEETAAQLPDIPSNLHETHGGIGGWAGLIAGAGTGTYVGAGLGIAGGPLGAIAGTVPGAIIGGIIGYFSGDKIGRQFDNEED